MNHLVEKRRYQRCSNLICKVMVSRDEKYWHSVDLIDISAGGMRFSTTDVINVNSKLFFQLYVYNMLSEFNLRLEAQVVRFEKNSSGSTYSVKFLEISKYYQIQLDELVKSKITVAEKHKSLHDEEQKSVLSRKKTRGIKIYF
ncbi:MAG: PilZ domain-containing protein [Clostridiales bacterium]